jgi:hypothetical protein
MDKVQKYNSFNNTASSPISLFTFKIYFKKMAHGIPTIINVTTHRSKTFRQVRESQSRKHYNKVLS